MSSKCAKNRWQLGLRPRPHWGAYSAPPDLLTGPTSNAPTSNGRGGEGTEDEERERERRRRQNDLCPRAPETRMPTMSRTE